MCCLRQGPFSALGGLCPATQPASEGEGEEDFETEQTAGSARLAPTCPRGAADTRIGDADLRRPAGDRLEDPARVRFAPIGPLDDLAAVRGGGAVDVEGLAAVHVQQIVAAVAG